jgi:hypothetical protein
MFVALAMVCSSAGAQLISSKSFTLKGKKTSDSGMILELGIGSIGGSVSVDDKSGDIKSDGLSVDLGLGYRKVFSPYVAWDIFKLRAFAEMKNLGETLTPQLLTAIRGSSPVLFGNARIYSSLGLGYGYVLDVEAGGLCVEFQAGIDLTSHVYLGLVYSSQKFSQYNSYKTADYNLTFTGLKLGFKF